ncbi:FkbM family methyltransferase [Adhaeribacter rhizoryzae]|uniref:FkbM family methyltransferase n=1 Tax=Adhaeribacter rhizoryzae TaxID=2607907 RepID=A0A5M6DBK1_9BACT|nr:FkbM family methyltransferase [Adhaeribacter rhizoryzae]KAA5544753.1 FkbM family methyltransferase [Adhaeribacter rhizoryzae]
MKHELIRFYRFIQLFGIIHGTRLFFNFILNKFNDIKIPFIKSSITLRPGTSDPKAFYQIFVEKEYDLTFPDNPKIIVDGGANIGLFTILMKNRFPDVKIISIEPDKDNFKILQKNVGSYSDIHCENCGIWHKATTLKVYDKYEIGKWGMVVEEDNDEGNIAALSIDAIMNKYAIDRIDILKLDIETSEKKVFMHNYERWLPKVKMIIIELHDWMEDDCAKPFFTAINNTFNRYEYNIKGENTIIVNKDLE